MEEKALVAVEVALGIVAGFIIWTFVAPMITSVSARPTA